LPVASLSDPKAEAVEQSPSQLAKPPRKKRRRHQFVDRAILVAGLSVIATIFGVLGSALGIIKAVLEITSKLFSYWLGS
jgi:hypothetical protein